MFVQIIIAVLLGLVTIQCSPTRFSLRSNDSILFLGGMNVLTGESMPHGFINVFKQEVQRLHPNINTVVGGFAEDDTTQLLANLNFLLQQGTKPTKAILSVGVETFIGHTDESSRIRLKFELESLVARLKQDKIEVILCPLTVRGERVDIENEMDDLIQLYTLINKQVASEYSVMYINIAPQVNQFLEMNNIDNLDHSVLTLDGSVLNERGHMFVALALLRDFGISQHSLVGDNSIRREQLRVLAIKQETDRLSERNQATGA